MGAVNLSCARGLRAGVTAAVCVLAWTSPGLAETGYPAQVDMALGKPGIVESTIAPKMGCQLCHTSSSGSTTTLQPFAMFMISQYGFPNIAAEEDSQVQAALARLKAAEPKLWADMQAGIDPNSDPVFTDSAPPQPQYGCSAAGDDPAGPPGPPAAALLLLGALAIRRSRAGRVARG